MAVLHHNLLWGSLGEDVSLTPEASFLPKVVSEFHISAEIFLPMFFPHLGSDEDWCLHSLDSREPCCSISNTHRKDPNLFISYSGQNKNQRLPKWIIEVIKLCYLVAKNCLPGPVKVHSTRALASSTTILKGEPMQEICRSAIWAISICLPLNAWQLPPPGKPLACYSPTGLMHRDHDKDKLTYQ